MKPAPDAHISTGAGFSAINLVILVVILLRLTVKPGRKAAHGCPGINLVIRSKIPIFAAFFYLKF